MGFQGRRIGLDKSVNFLAGPFFCDRNEDVLAHLWVPAMQGDSTVVALSQHLGQDLVWIRVHLNDEFLEERPW